ncbi:MAG: hypothetical protein HGB15_01820, partial [Chlorobaculum sp.]|nr:hypothetical protein [Chlorobaculum sp.]
MTTVQRHTIAKQFLDLRFNGSETGAMALQTTVSSLNRHDIAPAIERVLDRYATEGSVLRIDRLEIDAGAMPLDLLERRLPAMIAEALDKALGESVRSASEPIDEHLDKPIGRQLSEAEAAVDALLFFLRHGTLPAIRRAPSHERFEAQLLEAWQRTDLIRQTAGALAFPPARHRLLAQFSRQVAATLLEKLSPEAMAFIENLFDHFRHSGQTEDATDKIERELLDQALAIAATRPDIAPAELRETLLSAAMSLPEVGEESPRGEIATEATPLAGQPASETVSAEIDAAKTPTGFEPSASWKSERAPLSEENTTTRILQISQSDASAVEPVPRSDRDSESSQPDALQPTPASSGKTGSAHSGRQATSSQPDAPASDALTIKLASRSDRDSASSQPNAPALDTPATNPVISSGQSSGENAPSITRATDLPSTLSGLTTAKNRHPEKDTIEARRQSGPEQTAPRSKAPESVPEHPDERRGIYVENAGLVLLHPFLPQCFRALAIAGDVELLQPGQALRLLHHLATGFDTAPEYELTLPKI